MTTASIEPKRIPSPAAGRERRELERFESLVGDLSASMARAPAEAVDDEIDFWLAKICLALDLDRSAVYERDGQDQPVRATHTWLRPNFPPFPRNYDPEKLVKTTADWIMSGKSLTYSRASDIPLELADAKRFIERYGPKSSAVIPMWAGKQVIGAASFGKFRSAREWPSELIDHLALVVRLFGSAIERKQSVAAIQAVRAELRVATRRNTMSELVASLSHEINQPLGAILSNLGGVARLLTQGNPQPAMALEAVNNAIEDTKRTAEIVRRIRAMFKRHVEHKTSLDIGALVNEVVKLTAGEAAGRKTIVQTHVSPSVQWVIGDSIQIQQCLLNLIMNAFDAISEAKSDPREIVVRIEPERTGWIGVSVCDTGAGINPGVANRLFEPFVTTKREGMGLGLLVTRSIVEGHGGRISARPNADRGTTFTFTLPVAEKRRVRPLRRVHP
jgi:signal transduction histidine kinase